MLNTTRASQQNKNYDQTSLFLYGLTPIKLEHSPHFQNCVDAL